jgi:hypothetical protein
MRLLTVTVTIVLVLYAGAAVSEIPPYINYQGILTGPDGQAMPDGDYDMIFRLYFEQPDGELIWEAAKVVGVEKGIFKVAIGPLDLPFETLYWLGISVGGQPELEPRIALLSSPYCFTARTVQDSSITTNKLANGAIWGEKIADGQVVRNLNGLADEINLVPGANVEITPSDNNLVISATGGGGGVSGSGQAGQVAFWDGTSSISGDEWLYWDSANRRLGIGTSNANARLRVTSDEYLTGVFASTCQTDTTEVLRANYLGGGNYEATAIKGISRPTDGYGVGGDFTGGQYGLKATGNGGNTGRYIWGIEANASGNTANMSYRYGVWANAWGPSVGNNLGVVGYAYGEGNALVGVYGWGSGDNKNVWGVYGDVDGYGTEGKYAVYGETFGAGDSVYAGYFDGNLVYTGSFYKVSDRMFKTNLQPCDGALDKVLALEPRKYTYDHSQRDGISLPHGEHYGLIAQEVEEVFPELVGDLYHPAKPALRGNDPEIGESFGYKGINYIELIPILVQAIKEQQETITAHQQTIDDLRAKVEALENR